VAGSFLPALLLGVAFANIFRGLPLDQNQIMQGGLLDLLNPYGRAGGGLFVLLFLVHGALWLAIKAEGDLRERAAAAAGKLWPVLAGVIVLFLAYTFVATKLFDNYFLYPALFLILVLPVGGLVMARVWLAARKFWLAWGASAVLIVGTTLFAVIGLFPAILPSSLNPAWSLTATDAGIKASSSPLTLAIMLGVALVFVPIVIGYQFWVYKTFSFPGTKEELEY
jgi:cytochrome d ubiquinol oxidase subunit II